MATADRGAVFSQLRALLEPFAPQLVTVHDSDDHLYLDTAHMQQNGKPLFFAAVRTGKSYVSYHLMAVYLWPELLDDVSGGLRSRMQGKSCFNFRREEPDLITELDGLTRRAFERYTAEGYV